MDDILLENIKTQKDLDDAIKKAKDAAIGSFKREQKEKEKEFENNISKLQNENNIYAGKLAEFEKQKTENEFKSKVEPILGKANVNPKYKDIILSRADIKTTDDETVIATKLKNVQQEMPELFNFAGGTKPPIANNPSVSPKQDENSVPFEQRQMEKYNNRDADRLAKLDKK